MSKKRPFRVDNRKSASDRGYDNKWQEARAGFLKHHPWCQMCAELGKQTKATVVDHTVPHRGDMVIFWDKTKWAPLCSTCHNAHKQRLEKSGRVFGCDANGMPIDKGHRWNNART